MYLRDVKATISAIIFLTIFCNSSVATGQESKCAVTLKSFTVDKKVFDPAQGEVVNYSIELNYTSSEIPLEEIHARGSVIVFDRWPDPVLGCDISTPIPYFDELQSCVPGSCRIEGFWDGRADYSCVGGNGEIVNGTSSHRLGFGAIYWDRDTHLEKSCSGDGEKVLNVTVCSDEDKDGDGYYPKGSCKVPNGDCDDNDPEVHAGVGGCSSCADKPCCDDPCCETQGTGNDKGQGYTGEPISLLTGAETFKHNDLTIGSLYPINIERRYDSRSAYDSPIGYGWALNLDKRLYTYSDSSVVIRKECGWKRRFTWNIGGYVTPAGENGILVQNADWSFTFTEKTGTKENYDTYGRLASRVDEKGNSLVFTYVSDTRDPLWGLLPWNINQTSALIVSYNYRISKIEGKDASGTLTGKWVQFQYDSSTGRLTQLWDNAGRAVTYTYDGIGNLKTVSGPNGNASYGYNDTNNRHYLTNIDEGQGEYVNTYNDSGKIIKQTHGTGQIDIEYTTPHKETTVTTINRDSAGNALRAQARTVEFDVNGLVSKHTDTLGNVTIYIRDSKALIIREEYYENVGTVESPTLLLRTSLDFSYDSKGNMLIKTEAQGSTIEKTTTWTYHPVYSSMLTETVKSVVDPAQNRVITNTYDETTGNLLTTTETGLLGDGTPYSYTTTYGYDTAGHLTSVDGPRTDVSDVTTFFYDPFSGNLSTITQPLIGTTTYSNHDALGNPQTVTDPNGNSTTYSYDATGRVLTVKAPGDNATTQYFYISAGCTSCGGGANKIDYIILPEGNMIDYAYDSFGNLIKIGDNAGNSINYTYDSEGNRLTEEIRDASNVLQKTLSYQYDALNRLSKIINPDDSFAQYGYDFRGNRTSLLTPNSSLTSYQYDALNRLTSTLQPLNASTTYTYNSNNNLTSVKDANNNTTTYKYDDKGRVYQVISPDTGTTTYSYDPAGNLTSRLTPDSLLVNYQYDALNRLTKIDFPTDTDIIYTYDACLNGKGRLCTMTDASGTTTYEYSAKGQVTKETKVIDSIQYVTQYSYDQNGNLRTMTYPSGRLITYNYSNDRAVNVLNNAANLATNISYKPFGGMSSLTYGNGIIGTIGYDSQYRITGIQASSSMNLAYNLYDANGNIKSIQDVLDPTKNKAYDYDALDRLATANSSGIWGSLGWTYDGAGNRLTENANAYTYAPNANKLISANSASFGYDNNGNTITENSRVYTYSQNQRLLQVVDGAMTAGYSYNGNGQRVKKNVNGITTFFHYSLSGQIIAESNSAGNVTAEYVYLNGQPLAKMEGANTYYYHNDHLGTPQKMTDSSGAVVWAADYKPFGEATITISTITNNLRGAGQYFDAETGLLYNYTRVLNAAIGRYNEADRIGLRGGINLYRFVENNPLRFVDPFGLMSQQEKEDLINWVGTVAGTALDADPMFNSLGSALLDPNLFKVALQKIIQQHNLNELMKSMDDPNYQMQEIPNSEVDKNPWEALKKLKEIKTKKQNCQ